MNANNGKKYAFPGAPDWHASDSGLTKREYFAGLAMSGMLADSRTVEALGQVAKQEQLKSERALAVAAVNLSDALLAELAKGE